MVSLLSIIVVFSCVHATLHPALSVGPSVSRSHFTFFMIYIFGRHCSCPNGLVTSNMAPAHPHATSVAVDPALFYLHGPSKILAPGPYHLCSLYWPSLASADGRFSLLFSEAGLFHACALFLFASTTAKMSSILALPATKSSESRRDSTECKRPISRNFFVEHKTVK